MRHSITVAFLLLFASATAGMGQEPSPGATSATTVAAASESSAPVARKPDYSRQALLRFVASSSENHPPIPRRVQWGLGTVEFPLFGTRFRLAWLPFLPTLNPIGRHGSINPTVDPLETIDPFAMTGLDLPMKAQSAAERRELRRIERRLRRDQKQ